MKDLKIGDIADWFGDAVAVVGLFDGGASVAGINGNGFSIESHDYVVGEIIPGDAIVLSIENGQANCMEWDGTGFEVELSDLKKR